MIDLRTIGKSRAQENLAKILEKINDRKLTRLITNKFHDLGRGLNLISEISDKAFKRRLATLLYNDIKDILIHSVTPVPQLVLEHTLNSMSTYYKEAMKRYNE